MKRLSLLALLTLAPAYSAWNMHCGNLSSHFVLSAVRLPLTPAAIAAAAARWHAQLDQHLIPRLLHYTWSDCSSVPPRQSAWQKGCARVNPLHQQWLWSDDDNHALVATHYPQFLDLYDSYDEHMKRVDAARLFYQKRPAVKPAGGWGGLAWKPPPRKKPHKPHLHLSKAALAAPSTIDHRKTEPAT